MLGCEEGRQVDVWKGCERQGTTRRTQGAFPFRRCEQKKNNRRPADAVQQSGSLPEILNAASDNNKGRIYGVVTWLSASLFFPH